MLFRSALVLKNTPSDFADWQKMVDKFNNPKRKVTIALVGKYVELHDAYLSVAEYGPARVPRSGVLEKPCPA